MDTDFYKEWFCQLFSCCRNPSFYTQLCDAGLGLCKPYFLFARCSLALPSRGGGKVIESDERLEEEKWTCSFLLASCGLPILVTRTLAVLLHPGTSVFVIGVFQHL